MSTTTLRILLTLCAALVPMIGSAAQGAADPPDHAPEPGAEKVKDSETTIADYDPDLPNILLIGDSISQGYTRFVVKALRGKANVVHAPGNNGDSRTVAAGSLTWVKRFPQVQRWDVIHFNAGLHDLKRMKKEGRESKPSSDINDPLNCGLEGYAANLLRAVERLKQSGATLIFATTTPYPLVTNPARVPEDAVRYNEVAVKIMQEHGVAINDLYTWILPQREKYQLPANVHFKPEGSEYLGQKVAQSIEALLPTK